MSFLTVHITGGIMAYIVILVSVVLMIFRKGSPNNIRKALQLTALFQVITGIMVIFLVPGVSVSSVCFKAIIYLVGIIIVQKMVSIRYDTFPVKPVKPS